MTADGLFMAECFSGDGAMTLSAMVHGVPAVAPWDFDKSRSMDVLSNGRVFVSFCASGRVLWVHSGTPCTSNSWARDPPLRSWWEIEGLQ